MSVSNANTATPPWARPLLYLRTVLRLGIANVLRAVLYRACKRAGIYRWTLPQRTASPLQLTIRPIQVAVKRPSGSRKESVQAEADELLHGEIRYFSAHRQQIGNPPDWFLNPFRKQRHPGSALHWSRIADFSPEDGDIKVVWEMSRFSWAPVFARAYLVSGDARYLTALQLWVEDWWQKNPPNTGPNWMCAQEASIRLINTVVAFRLLGVPNTTELAPFIEAHCERIDRTTLYALAQDNNHATSEAAGLFVGGTWLATYAKARSSRHRERFAKAGRNLLERSVRRLVLPDGSFSQNSLTYHRVLLDSLSVVELWRRSLSEEPFAEVFYERAAAAVRWLQVMIERSSGDGPNLGANDGALPYRIHDSAYRDFRPCLQLASRLFLGSPASEDDSRDERADFLGLSEEHGTNDSQVQTGRVFPGGGYVILRNRNGARVLLRAPTARFRPSHADALHLDLWWNGINILRDGGTYSYADGAAVAEELASVVGHNTVQFDNRDQMPKIGRFLYGDWVRVDPINTIAATVHGHSWTGAYADAWGARHERTVTLEENTIRVVDRLHGYKRKATLRWRLIPAEWLQHDTGCSSGIARIEVESSTPQHRISLGTGWESQHYLEARSIPVLQVEVDEAPATLKTTITLF